MDNNKINFKQSTLTKTKFDLSQQLLAPTVFISGVFVMVNFGFMVYMVVRALKNL